VVDLGPLASWVGALIAWAAAWPIVTARRKRDQGRRALGAIAEEGQALRDRFRTEGLSEEERTARRAAWEKVADQAIRKHDAPQIRRFHQDIPGAPSASEVMAMRLEWLQEIIDRL